MACKNCYPYRLPECPESIGIQSESLVNGTTYLVHLTDKFGAVNIQSVVSGDGVLTISTDGFPGAYFNQYAGSFSVEVKTAECEPVELAFDGLEYDCIELSFFGSDIDLPESECVTTIK